MLLIFSALDHMGLMPQSAVDQPTVGPRQLQRRDGDGTLPDRHRDSLAGVPFLAEISDLPGRGWDQAFVFIWEVYAGSLSKSRLIRVERDLVYTGAVAHVVEVHITG